MSKKRAPRGKSDRAQRREAERDAIKNAEARLKLARLESGGSPERPIVVASASVVEPHAAGSGCVVCGATVRVEEHSAITREERALRVARVRCTRCSVSREIYFRLEIPLPN